MLDKKYIIIPNYFEYACIVINTTKEDIIFMKDDIKKDLIKLKIEGPVLFDRLLITGENIDRFSWDLFIAGDFLYDDGLRVLTSKKDYNTYSEDLKEFYKKNTLYDL